jgi:hypothetical protein
LVLLIDDRNIAMRSYDVGNRLHATVFRTIVDNNDFKMGIIEPLPENTFNAGPNIFLYIVYWYDDT